MYWLNLTIDGHQHWESCGTHNKAQALEILAVRKAEILQGRFSLLKKESVYLGDWSEKYLESVQHPNTRRRYACSRVALLLFFGETIRLNSISTAGIREFISTRRKEEIKAATINRDLRFLAQILKAAERERLISRSPFDLEKFFQNESKDRRTPLILTPDEQERLLSVAPARVRALTILGTESGLRSGEMLSLKWADIDIRQSVIHVVKSKTAAGTRAVPLSSLCKSELLEWRKLIGFDSEWVFPRFEDKRNRLQGARKAWASALKKAGIPFRPIYYLRHTFASRMTAVGVSPLTIASLLGHSSSQIVSRYSVVLDQNRLDAMKRLEQFRESSLSEGTEGKKPSSTTGLEIVPINPFQAENNRPLLKPFTK